MHKEVPVPRLLPHLAVITVLWLIPAFFVVYAFSTYPTTGADGRCQGIGPDCTLPQAGMVAYWSFSAAPYLFLGGCLVSGVIAALQWRRAAALEPAPWVEPDWPD